MSAVPYAVASAMLLVSTLSRPTAAQSCPACSIVDLQRTIDCFLSGESVGVCPGGTNCPAPLFEQAFDSGGFLNECQSPDIDVSHAKAVGVSAAPGLRMRLSGIHVDNVSYVVDLQWQGDTGAHIVPGSITQSAAPSISNLRCTGSRNTAPCTGQFPDRVVTTIDFTDANGDIIGGHFQAITLATLRTGGSVAGSFSYSQDPFDCPTPGCTSGTLSFYNCWGNVSHLEISSVSFKDAGEQPSNALSCSVDIP